jgi:hypothetical protein
MLLKAFHVAGLALTKTWLGRCTELLKMGREKNPDSSSFSHAQPRATIEGQPLKLLE